MSDVTLVQGLLLAFLVGVVIAVVRMRDLFAVVMLMGIFSLLSAGFMTTLDAVDVAFTEAAVGAGVSTVLFLATLDLTTRRVKGVRKGTPLALAVCILTGAVLVYGTLDMPAFGSPDTPGHQRLAKDYIERVPEEIDVPNIVTAILGSYRGYDTLGETTVVFTAGIGVFMLLGGRRRRGTAAPDEESVVAAREAMAEDDAAERSGVTELPE